MAKKIIKKVAKKKLAKKVVKKSVKKAVKKIVKRPAKKAAPKNTKPAAPKMPKGKKIGVVTHFYGNISVGIVKFSKPVSKGAMVAFHGATTSFSQVIDSMQLDHKEIEVAPAGQEVGMKVKNKVREGDVVYAQ